MTRRDFAALVDADGVWLVEYRREQAGFRVVGEWSDVRRAESAHDAAATLRALVEDRRVRRSATLRVALHGFGAVHHTMTLPGAPDHVLTPIVAREMQRAFNLSDPVIAFTAGRVNERRSPERADARTAPRPLFVGAAPRETVSAFIDALALPGLTVECVTLVPEAIRQLFELVGSDDDASGVLVCLPSGPHLVYFIDGRMELVLDPPIALEAETPFDSAAILAHVERGAVYLRQQFGGAVAKRLLLTAPPHVFELLRALIQDRLGVRVEPLMPQVTSPPAVVAMGAVLAAEAPHALDLFPHPASLRDRLRDSLRGSQGIATAASAVAALAALWAMLQVSQVRHVNEQVQHLRDQLNVDLQTLAPVRTEVERRASFMQRVLVAEDVRSERRALSADLAGLANVVPPAAHLDTLSVTRTQAGWATSVGGVVASPTAGESVAALNAFYRALSVRPGLTSANLDRFDYASSKVDTVHVDPLVRIDFKLSFTASIAANGGTK